MSGLNGKHKKYSWLPETNPPAQSTSSRQEKPAKSKSTRARPKGNSGNSGKSKPRGKGIDMSEPASSLGITMVSSEPAAEDDASGQLAAITPPVSKLGRKRPRKDSVDELVRSRFMSSHAPQTSSMPPAKPSRTSTPRGRKKAVDPGTPSITASVRDALASERTVSIRGSPSQQGTVAMSNNASSVGHGKHRYPSYYQGMQISGSSTPGNAHMAIGDLEGKYSFPAFPMLNPRNVSSTFRRTDRGVGPVFQDRGLEVTTGENVIVIHPGSRWLRVGRASDAVPRELPHIIARRARAASPALAKATADKDTANSEQAEAVSGDVEAEDKEEPETKEPPVAEESIVDETLTMLRSVLKEHQRQSKRKAPPNAYSQVMSFNKQATPTVIQDHNDPFKIEWIHDDEISGDYVVGEAALRIADTSKFLVRHPMRNGCFNVEDYATIEEVLGDIETIWSHVLDTELGLKRRDLSNYGAVLVIPDLFSRIEVAALSDMLLRNMGFRSLILQQSSTLVTFGAGFSSACVVDIGAQKTSIACVEDGYCHQESRVSIMHGADDITRFLFDLFQRSSFPYHEANLNRLYDWTILADLREKHSTLNLSDVNIRMTDFFVRVPDRPTQKYSFKTYDEMYLAPLCVFYPYISDAYYKIPAYARSFLGGIGPAAQIETGWGPPMCSHMTPTQFGILPSRPIEIEAPVTADQFTEAATAPATVPATEPSTPEPSAAPPAGSSATPVVDKSLVSHLKDMAASETKTLPPTPVVPTVTYYARMPLDAAITHSITHLYNSIVLVGGGAAFTPGFGEVLASRLMYSVERVDIVVLARLECAREMWVDRTEWMDFGTKLLRERMLFPW
ncbi:actin-like ATPase domain-containing protein [Linderina pennispora]|uniref:Actin-like ATPase domain-containing protein n=1 Tax=Linderina pennispora TaxID=61395 RepID=A0A1Y1W5H2_9FUNG|nr:actin-like ATPase domain-containing protein [Linderina pennispora]ORX68757.1 actin-like ATPase domain-containing protein [Linderina pennispora]